MCFPSCRYYNQYWKLLDKTVNLSIVKPVDNQDTGREGFYLYMYIEKIGVMCKNVNVWLVNATWIKSIPIHYMCDGSLSGKDVCEESIYVLLFQMRVGHNYDRCIFGVYFINCWVPFSVLIMYFMK